MLWKEEERSRIRALQMDNLRGLLGIRRGTRGLGSGGGGVMVGPEWGPDAGWTSVGIVGSPGKNKKRRETQTKSTKAVAKRV